MNTSWHQSPHRLFSRMDYWGLFILWLLITKLLSIVAEPIRNTVDNFWKLCKLELRSWKQDEVCPIPESVAVRGHCAILVSFPGYYGCGLTHTVQ